jgi:DNA primase
VGISPDDIDKVRSQTDIVAVISEHVGLRKQGSRWVGLCPFHAEKSGSFSVNQELGLYFCFGCQVKGDVITFVREIQHLDFVGAVESLASRLGITLTFDSSTEGDGRKKRKGLIDVMNKAVDWYHERLLTSPDAAKARGYLRSRGYDGEVVRTYKLGWAPDDWDVLCKSLKVPADDLRETGLAFLNKRNRLQDAFRARVLFPIFDARGDAVAIGGRILPGSTDPAKYKNSASSTIYDKSETLYGLNWAKGPAVAQNEIVVCEGYTDVIGMAQAGVTWAVATCGTALTDRHFATLKNFSRRIVLAYDADAAGQGAAERFYEWEKRHDVDVYVAALPPGADPGDLARSDPDALRQAVAGATPFLAFRLHRLLAAANLSTVEGRARAAEQAMAMVGEHPNQLVRDQYVMEIADRCRVEPDRLRAGLAEPRRTAPAPEPRRPRPGRSERPSLMVLRLAVHQPEAVAHLLDEVLFTDEVELGAYRALASAPTLHEAIEAADPEAAELLQRLAVEEVDVEPDAVLSLLIGEAAQRALREVDADQRVSDDPLAASETVAWLKLRLEESREAATRGPALEQLVAFLIGRRREEGNDR